jgi:hypothetical protein
MICRRDSQTIMETFNSQRGSGRRQYVSERQGHDLRLAV